ncbi:ribonuclease D, partial [Vibrio sp. Vb2880]|nr:ribonuclease D [Vibrio sp. Vb2880]
MNYQIITKNKDLEEVCTHAREADVVMLDTEFVRIRTFYPQLGLIQLFDGNRLSLIDPTELTDMTPFVALLKDTSVLKVLHACGEDLEV